jgi:hypothetical protein
VPVVSIKTIPDGIDGLRPNSPPAFIEATVESPAIKFTDPDETYNSFQGLVSDPKFLSLPEGTAWPPKFIFPLISMD